MKQSKLGDEVDAYFDEKNTVKSREVSESTETPCYVNMTYKQAFEDHAYLWSIGSAYDMSGGYVDQEDLDKLLAHPTKATARKCLCDQIDYWFDVGPDVDSCLSNSQARRDELLETDKKVRLIAERHCCA